MPGTDDIRSADGGSRNGGSRLTRIARTTWILAITLLVAAYGWFRIRTNQPNPIARSPRVTFERLNRTGQVIGAGRDTIIVFSNYSCAYCARLFAAIDSTLAVNPSALAVRFKHFAHPGLDSTSFLAAVASECASRQGDFVRYSRWLFTHEEELRLFVPTATARAVGIASIPKFESCIGSNEPRFLVIGDLVAGVSLTVHGTPTIIMRRFRSSGTLAMPDLLRLAAKE